MRVYFRNPKSKKLEFVALISAETLDETFVKTQNTDTKFTWLASGCVREYSGLSVPRSSSVGDVFVNKFDEAFIVAPTGFLRFPAMDQCEPNDVTIDTFELVMGYNEC